jgi:hypothetical protein
MIAYDLKDWVTIVIAPVGAVIGGVIKIIWDYYNQNKVKLTVRPKYADNYPESMGSSAEPKGKVNDLYGERGCIEVFNRSKFPVTIAEIGFTYPNDPQKKTLHAIGVRKADGTWLPWRLEARQGETGYFPLSGVLKPGAKEVYARTACGKVVRGTSAAFKEMRRRAQSALPLGR